MPGARIPTEELVQTKPTYQEANVPRKIKQIRFDVMSPTEIVNTGEFQVYERALYKMPERRPQPSGVLDPRLGVSNKRATCETCGQMLAECTGHFAYITLELPVFHIGYFRNTLQILQCICKGCARVLLNEEERHVYVRRLRSQRTERVQREAVFRRVLERCKRVKLCPHCGEYNGSVKKTAASLKVIHDPWPSKTEAGKEARAKYHEDLQRAAQDSDHIRTNLKHVVDDLNPLRVMGLFTAIPDEDCELLDLAGRPEHLLMTHIPVPPVSIRPSVEMDAGAGSNEDDLTMKLMQIVEVNNILRTGLERGLPVASLAENWDFLQVQCAVYINSDLPGVTSMYQVPGKPTRGFVQRLKGKQGRFRGNLSGKRVDFSGRTVISPDPNLRVDEVGVPILMATTLTYPERVTQASLEKLRRRVLAGASEWPGANFVVFPSGDKVFLKFGDRRRIAAELCVGDVVERHLEDGDVVLFNRQPSLHRMSIMAHRVRVMAGRTLRFNECVCNPYNADFDGDEMNIHVPQTEEARAEALHLMGVIHNLCTPKSGEILIAATQDFLTAAFLLTSKDTFLTQPEICQLAGYMTDNKQRIDLPPPAILAPVQLWTGKQAFSLLIRPNTKVGIFVNLEAREKQFRPAPGEDPVMQTSDGLVVFRNSELLCGRLGKGTLGGGNKSGLFEVLTSDYSPAAAAEVMNRLAKLAARLVGDKGFSIGVDDVTPAPALLAEKQRAVRDGYTACANLIAARDMGELELDPGCDGDETLETKLSGKLNSLRETAAAACMLGLHRHNSPLIMSQCGSKGSPINIAQMVACVGQQSVGGKRAPNGFRDRSLPHFARDAREPEAKGFVANSFYSGLSPTEFFFHAMAGREGLVDTAVKTAETGYMSRRLMKAMEDLYVHYDGSVRNAAGGVVQMRYGEDGMDPVGMEGAKGEPVAFARMLALVQATRVQGSGSGAGGAAAGGGPAPMELDEPAAAAASEAAGAARGRRRGKAAALPPAAAAVVKEEEAEGGEGLQGVTSEGELVPLPAQLEAAIKAATASSTFAPTQFEQDAAAWGTASGRQDAFCSNRFRDDLREFLQQRLAAVRATRALLGLPANARGAYDKERLLLPVGLTRAELAEFVQLCCERYESKRVDPGSTVGAFGAQSIGEPGTQMTLKTFHFAGVASMNVTLGVPRIKEIINAARNISTPYIEVSLDRAALPPLASVSQQEDLARTVKGRMERTTLGHVARSITEVIKDYSAYVKVVLCPKTLQDLGLVLTPDDVKSRLVEAPRLRLKEVNIKVAGPHTLHVEPPQEATEKERDKDPGEEEAEEGGKKKKRPPPLNVKLDRLLAALQQVPVLGIPTVTRAVISTPQSKGKAKGSDPQLMLYVEGTDLTRVMGTDGVDGVTVSSNNVMEVAKSLGIEAARQTIMRQITYTMEQHGMRIDARHTMLLADCMSYRGEVLGITRFGIAKMKDSVLMLASFEKTTDHLFDAALHGRVDDITGVSESIIMGTPMPTGTGLFKVLQQPNEVAGARAKRRPPPVMA